MAKQPRRVPPAVPPRPAAGPGPHEATAAAAELRQLIDRAESARRALAEQVREAHEVNTSMRPLLKKTQDWIRDQLRQEVEAAMAAAVNGAVADIQKLTGQIIDTFNLRADQQADLLREARQEVARMAGLETPEQLMRWLGANMAATMRQISAQFMAEVGLNDDMPAGQRDAGIALFGSMARLVAEGGVTQITVNPATGEVRKIRPGGLSPG